MPTSPVSAMIEIRQAMLHRQLESETRCFDLKRAFGVLFFFLASEPFVGDSCLIKLPRIRLIILVTFSSEVSFIVVSETIGFVGERYNDER